ncbi:hypothetical protein GmHk_02G004451 [Glycine max]|nr:hypothetical protein GmHk_02G004451 [Glycine max]
MKKEKVVTCLHSALVDDVFTNIMHLKTTKQIWDELNERHAKSCDLKKLTIFEMVSKLHAHELRFSMRLYDVIEGTFQARHKGKQPIQKDQNKQQCKRGGDQKEKANKMGVQPNLYQGTIFLLALHAKGQTTCLKIVDIRGSLKFNVTIARTTDIKRGTTDLRKINLTHNLAHQVNLTNEQSKA